MTGRPVTAGDDASARARYSAPMAARKKRPRARSSEIDLSLVIPVYNEEAILEHQLRRLVAELRELGRPFEVIVAANGCRDQTVPLVRELMRDLPEVVVLELPVANYGAALKTGILSARGRMVGCDEIDLCDVDFHKRALRRLDHDECDMVVGSKAMPGARDKRPLTRRAATKVITKLLWVSTGFRGTDTHGLKAFVRAPLLPVVQACVVDKDLFASELVIRAARSGLRVHEIPIEVEEQRSPPIALVRRVPRVARDLVRLVAAIHLDRK